MNQQMPIGKTIAEKRTENILIELRNDIYWTQEEEDHRAPLILIQQQKDAVELSQFPVIECPICHTMVHISSLNCNFGHMESNHPYCGGF